ncbi:divalent metal cation transporter, partial [Candidatus Peregrinibacteria bacterium]|nr:divalent metal cation transporter [Candidatus Peregrinibacteria bacterium]
AGASFGYRILWVMIRMTLVLAIIQEMCARIGVVSGKGLSDLIRESYGVKVIFYLLLGLLFANLATVVAEFSGVAGSMEIFGIPRWLSVPSSAFLVWSLIYFGNYRSVEKVFLLAAVIYAAYIISGFLAEPEWRDIGVSFARPSFDFSNAYLLMLVGMIGTTITPWMQFYLQASVVEKGVKIENYKYSKWDVVIGAVITDIVAAFIMIASAAALFQHGIHIETASDAARALAPFAGRFAETLFAVGLLNASLLGASIVSLSSAYSICEGLGFESGVDKRFREAPWFYGILTAVIIIGAIPAVFPKAPLIKMMLVSQVINGVLLAPILIFIVLLANKKWLMGEHINKPWYNFVAWAAVGILAFLSAVLVVTAF